MKCMKLTTLVVSISLLLAVPAASADIMTYEGLGLTSSVRLHAPGLLGDGKRVRAGEYRYTYQAVLYNAFCVDIDHYAGTSEVTQEDISFLHNGKQVAYLYETFLPTIADAVDAAALGAALWEVIYEEEQNDLDAGGGYIYITDNAPVLAAANDMLAGVPDSYEPLTDLLVLHSQCRQDMLIGVLGEVPEPATLALLALGAPLALLAARRH